jgi:hypothetical protein
VINSFSKSVVKTVFVDTITDFTLGNTKTNTNADIIDLSDLLVGYSATSNLSVFVTDAAVGVNTTLTIDHDGAGALNSLVIFVMAITVFTTDVSVMTALYRLAAVKNIVINSPVIGVY